jgi:AcrR family transcriptional regulator
MEYKKRAISDLEKKQKIDHIVGIAEMLLTDGDFREITMARIAQEAGLAKGTLFIYFQTKEDVFLSLLERKMAQWHRGLAGLLESAIREGSEKPVRDFIHILLDSVQDNVLLKLLAILDDTLEQNIDFRRAVGFKTFQKETLADLGRLVEEFLQVLYEGDGMVLLNQLFICLIGVYKVSHPSEIGRKVVKEPGLEFFDREFFETLREMVTCQLVGFMALNKRQ